MADLVYGPNGNEKKGYWWYFAIVHYWWSLSPVLGCQCPHQWSRSALHFHDGSLNRLYFLHIAQILCRIPAENPALRKIWFSFIQLLNLNKELIGREGLSNHFQGTFFKIHFEKLYFIWWWKYGNKNIIACVLVASVYDLTFQGKSQGKMRSYAAAHAAKVKDTSLRSRYIALLPWRSATR